MQETLGLFSSVDPRLRNQGNVIQSLSENFHTWTSEGSVHSVFAHPMNTFCISQ